MHLGVFNISRTVFSSMNKAQSMSREMSMPIDNPIVKAISYASEININIEQDLWIAKEKDKKT